MSDDLSIPNPSYRGNRAGRYGAGQSRLQRMQPGTLRLIILGGGIGTVLLVFIAIFSLTGHRGGEVPVVSADTRPLRVKPENPGGMKIDGAENDVFSAGSDTANAKLAPPSENPDAQALHMEAGSAPPQVTERAPPAAVVPAPAPVEDASPPATGKPASVAPVPGSLTTGGSSAPAGSAAGTAGVASAPPAAEPAAAAPGKAAMVKAPATAAPHATGHRAVVQLAALSSEAAARNEWHQLAKRMPDLLNGRQPVFSRVEHNGHVFWRIRTSGFADAAQARSFCDRVKAKGAGCSVADF